MSVDLLNLTAILAMAVATYATRVGGALAIGRFRLEGRAATAIEAVPAAVLTAVIAPAAIATGPAETLAAIAAAIAATKLPLLGTVAVGVLAAILFRAVL